MLHLTRIFVFEYKPYKNLLGTQGITQTDQHSIAIIANIAVVTTGVTVATHDVNAYVRSRAAGFAPSNLGEISFSPAKKTAPNLLHEKW